LETRTDAPTTEIYLPWDACAMTMPLRCLIAISCALFALLPARVSAQPSPREEEALLDFFEKKIRPVLIDNCFNCHSANTNSKGGLRVDDRNGLTVGGGRGAAIVPGHPEKSLLMQVVRHTHAK